MPYKSQRQRRFFNANREKLESQGVDVDEYNRASKGMDLPETKGSKKKRKSVFRRYGKARHIEMKD